MIGKDIIKKYIDNEIVYLKQDIEGEKRYNLGNYNVSGLEEDLTFLTKLSESDIDEITRNVNDDEKLSDMIYETIHNYLYDCIYHKQERGKKNED